MAKIKLKTERETASELTDRNYENIIIINDDLEKIGDIPAELAKKQDKLTSANAGENITITTEDGIIKINSAATIPDINGDNITATINGVNKHINEAISTNETNIANNAKALANKADKSSLDNINEKLDQHDKLINTNIDNINKKANNDIQYSPDLETEPVQAGLGDLFYNTSDKSYIRSYHSAQNKRITDVENEAKNNANSIEQLANDKANKTEVVALSDTIAMDVEFKDGSTGSYKVIKNV